MHKFALSILLILLGAATLVLGFGATKARTWPHGYRAEPVFATPQREFPYCCPKPDWWAQVAAPGKIDTLADFDRIWRDSSISRAEKAKAIFQAIHDHMHSDRDITAFMVNYYRHVDPDYPALTQLLEFGVGQYFYYDRSLDGYHGGKGDIAAGMVIGLAGQYNAKGDHEAAAALLVSFIVRREADVNDHLLEQATLELAGALDRQGRKADALAVIDYAIGRYDGSWEHALVEARSDLKQGLGLRYYLLGLLAFFNSGTVLFYSLA